MKHKLIVTGVGVLLLAAGLQAAPALAGPQARRGNSAIVLRLPLRVWAKSYIALGMQTGKYVPHVQLSLPLVWLYDPPGRPVAFYTGADAAKLKAVLAAFPGSLERRPSLKNEPDLALMYAVLRKAGARPLGKPRGKRYMAVFYTEGRCDDECARFTYLLQAAAQRHPGEWEIVTIHLAKD